MVEPEVEVFAHIYLLECVQKTDQKYSENRGNFSNQYTPLFLSRFLDLLVKANGNNICMFHMVQIVAADQCDHGTLGNQDHIPSRGESNESWKNLELFEVFIGFRPYPQCQKTRVLYQAHLRSCCRPRAS